MSTHVQHLINTVADFVHVCDAGEYRSDDRLIGDAYHRDSVWFLGWFIDVFVTDQDHKRRFVSMLRSIDDFARDLARYHRDATGKPLYIPPRVIDELKRRIVTGYFPHVDEIVREAKHGQPMRAKEALLRTMRHDAWRMRS